MTANLLNGAVLAVDFLILAAVVLGKPIELAWLIWYSKRVR